MSHDTQTRVRSRIAPLGLALALIAVAVPFAASAAAKEPALEANPCAPVARNVPPGTGSAPAPIAIAAPRLSARPPGRQPKGPQRRSAGARGQPVCPCRAERPAGTGSAPRRLR